MGGGGGGGGGVGGVLLHHYAASQVFCLVLHYNNKYLCWYTYGYQLCPFGDLFLFCDERTLSSLLFFSHSGFNYICFTVMFHG